MFISLPGYLAIAVIFHFGYIWTIFDIYFVSPIVHGMRHHASGVEPPAKRLFFIVGDGFRADKCFQSHPPPFRKDGDDPTPRPLAPYLRSRVLEAGSFGVSHTRMPTESRPGHVALIAGLYEDVSSVTTGWKLNPVNFDSVFNQSHHTWSWGSPDILEMFKQGATPGKVDAYMYSEEDEDFTSDATKLDTWVFENVKAFFDRAKTDPNLNAAVHGEKVVFFLHLLGLDTTGHGFRPYSQEYLYNIQVVDRGVQELVELVDQFFNHDDRTAWVFTADHGMSDWGSHGDGHPDNTRTPLITWGAGIRKPELSARGQVAPGHDSFSSDWHLDHVKRVDVEQADIAALMAYLIGTNYPANSVGVLPLDYLDANNEVKAKAIYANAREILEMFRVKEGVTCIPNYSSSVGFQCADRLCSENKKTTRLNFVPFGPLHNAQGTVDLRLEDITSLINSGDHAKAIELSKKLISVSLEGLRYMQTYDWLFLRTLVTLGFIGWVFFALTLLLQRHVIRARSTPQDSVATDIVFASLLTGICALLWAQHSPWTYYAYSIAPVFFWRQSWLTRDALLTGIPALVTEHVGQSKFGLAAEILAFIAMLEAIVLGYSHRTVFTVCFLIGTTWPWFYGSEFINTNKLTVFLWTICCVSMSIFTVLPVVKVESLMQINLGGFLMLLAGASYTCFGSGLFEPQLKSIFQGAFTQSLLGFQCGLIALSMIVTTSSVQSLQAKHGLPLGNQILGWFVIVSSLLAPFLHMVKPLRHHQHRLMIMFLSFSPSFVLLTISYEGLFYVSFCATLAVWVQLEYQIRGHAQNKKQSSRNEPKTRSLVLSDFRIALFYFFFIQAGFFGTGNVASLAMFSLESVCRLIPVFSPFSMTALLIFKLMIPFAIISANLGILNRMLRVPPSAIFMIVMSFSDALTMNFFYLVKDEGSWLDIGTTISNYVIASLLCVFVAVLELFSNVIMGSVEESG